MTGLVTSNKMTNAVVVTVYSTKMDLKYKKRFKVRKKYVAYAPDSSVFTLGDKVEIKAVAPISKTIRWEIVN
jgi:ribosomal protein S17